jgi:membrane protease YdiL (CAAX protease family)
MRQDGSAPSSEPKPLPAWLAPLLVLLGIVAMGVVAPFALRLGLRPGLILSELALVSPGLLELQYAVHPPPPGYLEAFRLLHERLRPKDAFDLVVSLLAIAAAPSLCEETLFRGLVLPSFLRRFGPIGASLGSAALFGLIHLDRTIYGELSLYRVPFAFAVGLGFAALRLRTRGLLPCIAAHAALNALTFLIAPLTDDPNGGLPEAQPLLGAALFGLGLALAWLVLRSLRSR